MASKRTLHISGSFEAGGTATVKSFTYGCQTCAGVFDIEIPFEIPSEAKATTVMASAADMGQGRHNLKAK